MPADSRVPPPAPDLGPAVPGWGPDRWVAEGAQRLGDGSYAWTSGSGSGEVFHRPDGPARICVDDEGRERWSWYRHGYRLGVHTGLLEELYRSGRSDELRAVIRLWDHDRHYTEAGVADLVAAVCAAHQVD